MNQLIISQEQVQPLVVQTLPQVTAESFATVTSVIMIVWMGAFVVQQVIKVVKREEIERPPIMPK